MTLRTNNIFALIWYKINYSLFLLFDSVQRTNFLKHYNMNAIYLKQIYGPKKFYIALKWALKTDHSILNGSRNFKAAVNLADWFLYSPMD